MIRDARCAAAEVREIGYEERPGRRRSGGANRAGRRAHAAAGHHPGRAAATAEEVVQYTWPAVVEGIGGFAGRSSFRTGVFSILIKKARRRGAERAVRGAGVARRAGFGIAQQAAAQPVNLVYELPE